MPQKGKSNNPWILHVKKCKNMKVNKGKPLKNVLQYAKTTYKKK